MTAEYEAVIGLEVHVELLTDTKLFCGCSTAFGAEPNSQVCPVCLGLPGGTLPLLNRKAIEYTIKTALALNCHIEEEVTFDRKNYFYADLPKGYQISQFFRPLGTNGYIEIKQNGESKKVGIRQLHLEEDTGKLFHAGEDILSSSFSSVDFNRAGMPLIEIVTEPDIRTGEEARAFLQKLRSILRYIDVSDCKMEEGSLRCDANVSIRTQEGSTSNKTELKNMNSFKSVFKGIGYEIERQQSLVKEGKPVAAETRHWDEAENITKAMRSKLASADYRCFPDPNLLPLKIEESWVQEIKETIPELPDERYNRFVGYYDLPPYDAEVLTSSLEIAEFFDHTLQYYDDPKTVSNWIMSELLRLLNASNTEMKDCKIHSEYFGKLLGLIDKEVISNKIAKSVFEDMFESGEDPESIVEKKGLKQISDEDTLFQLVDEAISNNPQSVEDYLKGKKKALGFLVGEIMKKTNGQANPQRVNEMLREKIEK